MKLILQKGTQFCFINFTTMYIPFICSYSGVMSKGFGIVRPGTIEKKMAKYRFAFKTLVIASMKETRK